MPNAHKPETAAEALLMRLKARGVDYLLANGGTDFPPIIEGLANGAAKGAAMPEALVIPHESAAMGMAHGYYLATGRPQAVMVHVNVGLANTVMGVINAASDNIPVFVMAGRTPLTEHDRFGARMTPIQYGQEMRDQAAMIREPTKWDYELRYAEQAANLVDRALSIAMSEPRGPVYLGLPREPLADPWPDHLLIDGPAQETAATIHPDPAGVSQAAELLRGADNPLIICQRGDPEGKLGAILGRLAHDHAIPVVEFWPIRNVLPTDHPMHLGFDPSARLRDADVVLVVDCPVPWIQRNVQPGDDARVIHLGPDPLFERMPVRSFRADIAIASDSATGLEALATDMAPAAGGRRDRFEAIKADGDARRAKAEDAALSGTGSPMSPAYVSRCIAEAMDDDAMLFNELGGSADFMRLTRANSFFTPPYSGGLGWGLAAALGASLADRDRLVIACVGDGPYTFANPVACHQIAEALELPILTVVMNNNVWNAVRRAALALYPDGQAAKMNRMPITSLSPTPDYTQIAAASRGWSRRVDSGADLPGALADAIQVIRSERRQALLEVAVSI